jgi:hypothetical protein
MARARPESWAGKKVSLFGVVVARENQQGAAAVLTLGIRTLQPKNLCAGDTEDTCRTTVSEKESERVVALVTIASPEDLSGQHAIGLGSLLRVIGTLAPPSTEGSLTIRGSFYRHWPARQYVTTASVPQ